jgi:predicted SAM-dependent methyltransferase
MKHLKLNLGSGTQKLDGYENLDRIFADEIWPLAVEDESCDEIRASHVLEHFREADIAEVIRDWAAKLRPGGVLKIAVPDLDKIAAMMAAGAEINYAGYIMGGQVDENDYHRSVFTAQKLRALMEAAGLCFVTKWQSEIRDCASLEISLNLSGTKPVYGSKLARREFAAIEAKKANIYSQFGEDGIIQEIFARIGTKNRVCCEVGAADGIMFSSTRRLIEEGWRGILIEKDRAAFERLIKNSQGLDCFTQLGTLDGTNTLDYWLRTAKAPADIDLVVVDIDGQDFHAVNQMLEFFPRVLVVEYDPAADSDYIPPASDAASKSLDQAGKEAVLKLGASKGYGAAFSTETNWIFVRHDECIRLLCMDGEDEVNSQDKQPADAGAIEKVTARIGAVMSMPRLCFTQNMACAFRAITALGIDLKIGYGVFWGQAMTRGFEQQLDSCDWILAVDYDTYYTKEHILALGQVLAENPHIDAVAALQVKREDDQLLAGLVSSDGRPTAGHVAISLDEPLIEVATAHFGLTVIRAEALKRAKKPWFWAQPNKQGTWSDGRCDEDIWFWNNWRKSGNNIYLATHVRVGHLQLVCTWPGELAAGFKPMHQYCFDLEHNGIPAHCVPGFEDKI